MEVFNDFREIPEGMAPCVATIGSFDGLHLGHQWLLKLAREAASGSGRKMAVLTFQPHPARALAPGLSPPLLMPLERKQAAFRHLGVERALFQRFDLAFAALSAGEFAQKVLAGRLAARRVVIGDDFTFGKARSGRAEDLTEFGRRFGFEVEVIQRLSTEGITISSTGVRSFVLQGNVRGAALLLGRPYLVEGRVVTGLGRGRKLGFPTANLQTGAELLPAAGVYTCDVWVAGKHQALPAVTNVGVSPTFGPGPLRVEAHLLEEAGDLVGLNMAIAFLDRIRGEQVFSNAKALISQMQQDVAAAREYHRDRATHPAIDPIDGVDLVWPGQENI